MYPEYDRGKQTRRSGWADGALIAIALLILVGGGLLACAVDSYSVDTVQAQEIGNAIPAYAIYVDPDTGVNYLVPSHGGACVMVTSDGTPKITK